jgi:hypothetical protein
MDLARVGMFAICTFSAACFYEGSGYVRSNYGETRATAAAPRPAYHDRAFDVPASDLDAFVTKQTEGYAKVGAPIATRLDGFEPVPVRLERGRCYRMVIRLDPGASFSELARRGVAFVYHNGDRGMEVNGGPGIHGPTGGVASAGCPQQSAHATFDIIANWGSAMDKSHVHELGTGGVTLQLYAKRVDARKLAELKADEDRQIAEAEAFKREEARKARMRFVRGCRVCQQRYTECLADWRRGASRATCRREYDSCAFEEAGLASAMDCER